MVSKIPKWILVPSLPGMEKYDISEMLKLNGLKLHFVFKYRLMVNWDHLSFNYCRDGLQIFLCCIKIPCGGEKFWKIIFQSLHVCSLFSCIGKALFLKPVIYILITKIREEFHPNYKFPNKRTTLSQVHPCFLCAWV